MKYPLEESRFDTRMEPSDWRFSAAIVGLMRYFDYHDIPYEIDDDGLNYNKEDLDEQRYLQFAEYYFADYMHHTAIEDLISRDELDEKQIRLCNEKLKANTICKKVFKGLDYKRENIDAIRRQIDEHRPELIKETYRNGKSLYAKFCNVHCLLTDTSDVCRLVGYNVDTGRKMKTISYAFDKKTFVYQDVPEFDFIPFAFTKTYEGFFINNNATIKQLYKTNENLQKALDDIGEKNQRVARRCVFMRSAYAGTFIDYDVEVIQKNQDRDYFETMLIRKKATDIFAQIGEAYKLLTYPCFVEKCGLDVNGYIPVEQIVTDSIINLVHLDRLIEILLKDPEKGRQFGALVNTLVKINSLIYGGKDMDIKIIKAKAAAAEVEKTLFAKQGQNKLNSYKQRLISAITFKDYDRFCEVLLQLSAYTGVPFEFAYDLFEDFEANKNVAYAFVNRLNGEYRKSEKSEKEEN